LLLCSDHYSNSKIYSEVLVSKFCVRHALPHTIIRPGFIYGEGDRKFVPRLIAALEAGKVKYIGSGEHYLNTVYVGNVVRLIAESLGNPRTFGEKYNIADRDAVTVRRFITDLANALGLPVPLKTVRKGLALGVATVMEKVYAALRIESPPPLTRKQVTFLARSRRIDSSKAYDLLGGVPFSYEEGMRRTLDALKKKAS
jgi:nucleoside-diphosphate-sugar epimerase